MLTLLKRYGLTGINKAEKHLQRSVVVTNYFALILFGVTLAFILFLLVRSGFTPGIYRLLPAFLVYALIPILQYKGHHIPARLLAACFVPVFIIWLVTQSEQQNAITYTPSYFVPRMLAMATCIIPPMVFDTISEKKWLGLSIGVCAICVLGYDFLLPLSGREVTLYEDTGKFLYYNLVFALLFVTIVSSAIIMKQQTDRADAENERLLKSLEAANKELSDLLAEQEALNEELRTHTEELHANQEKLEEAGKIIEKQKEELQMHNEKLEKLVLHKTHELLQSNAELAKTNSELRQFSFTLSHNLRAPVARIIGLANLLLRTEALMNDEQKQYLRLLSESTTELDHVIRDMNKIVDIRNEVYRIKEKIYLIDEVSRILLALKEAIPPDAKIITDFEKAPYVYAIRPMVTSILFNLISNAVKYRSPERVLAITISSALEGDSVVVKIKDNGLGINLKDFGKDLFGMYKRFHTHTEGRGLGLFLVKTQMELMEGWINAESHLNVGTCFTLYFKRPQNVAGQICTDNESGTLYFHAPLHACGLAWKNTVTSQGYRQLFHQAIEILRLYRTPFWISDLRNQGKVEAEDLNWMLQEILPQAVQLGLTHVAVIYNPLKHSPEYIEHIRKAVTGQGLTTAIFITRTEAEAWLESLQNINQISSDG